MIIPNRLIYNVGCFLSPCFCQTIILFVRVTENTPQFAHGTYFFRLHCIKVVYSFVQNYLERPDWLRYLKCCLNFKINRLKQTIVDKSVHFVNFWLRNFKPNKRQMKILEKILKNYIWTYQNGLHRGRSDSERGKSFNDPKDIYQPSVPKAWFSLAHQAHKLYF